MPIVQTSRAVAGRNALQTAALPYRGSSEGFSTPGVRPLWLLADPSVEAASMSRSHDDQRPATGSHPSDRIQDLLAEPNRFRLEAAPLAGYLRTQRALLASEVAEGTSPETAGRVAMLRALEQALVESLDAVRWVSTAVYATEWQVGEASVRRWCRQQSLRCKPRGNAWQVDLCCHPPRRKGRRATGAAGGAHAS